MARKKTPVVDVSTDVPEEEGDEVLIPDLIQTEEGIVFTDANGDEQIIPLTDDGEVSVEKRRMQAVALRLSGATYAAIGRALGVSIDTARAYCRDGIIETDGDTIKMLRSIHHQRLESLLQRAWAGAMGIRSGEPDVSLMNTAIAILDRIDRLHGLSANIPDESADDDGGVIILGGNTAEYRQKLRLARGAS